jgi:hypothetical protein
LWQARNAKLDLFLQRELAETAPFMAHSEGFSNRQFRLSPARSVAGLGVAGLFGPRDGTSSGILPGNSCGGGGAPGSWTGGGISGLGLPGGASRGGSVGWPGVAGGISGGSIGIAWFHRSGGDNGPREAMFPATVSRA